MAHPNGYLERHLICNMYNLVGQLIFSSYNNDGPSICIMYEYKWDRHLIFTRYNLDRYPNCIKYNWDGQIMNRTYTICHMMQVHTVGAISLDWAKSIDCRWKSTSFGTKKQKIPHFFSFNQNRWCLTYIL